MEFDWREFFEFSKNIKNNPSVLGPKEAALRSAISRAYFSAYHYALDYAEEIGYKRIDKGADHTGVLKYLSEYSDVKVIFLSNYLKKLHNYRLEADYDNKLSMDSSRLVPIIINDAEQFFDTLHILNSEKN